MQARTATYNVRSAALLLSAGLVILNLTHIPVHQLAVYHGAEWWHSLTYIFMHGNIAHLLCNVWFFLIIVFYYRPSSVLLLTTYLTAVVFGLLAIRLYDGIQIAGMSAWIYALLGRYAWRGNKSDIVKYNGMMLASMLPSLLLTGCSFTAHICCYACSAIVSVFVDPIYCINNNNQKSKQHVCNH